MELVFKRIDERDIDMLIMDRLSGEGPLLDLILDEVEGEMPGGRDAYELVKIRHSATTRNGESDLVLTLASPGNVHAVLIEDKIDAPAQPQQATRYERRGAEGIAAGDWASYSVVLVAPEEYPQGPYPHKVTYQQMRAALPEGDAFARRMLSDAIYKQESGWQPNRSDVMTAFYDEVAKTAKRMHVKARCTHQEGDIRAERTAWVNFESPLRGTRIEWKSNQGRVMLAFRGWGGKEDVLKERVGEIPAGSYWRKWDKGVNKAYLCIDAIEPVVNWAEATKDAPLIVDALYKVQRLYDYALELNNRVIDWTRPTTG